MFFSKCFFLLKLGTERGYSRLWLYNKNWVFVIVEAKSAEGEVIEKTLIHKIRDREEGIVIYSFTHGFRFWHGSELTYFWKLCQARRQQLHSSIRREKLARRREPAWDRSFQPAGVRVGRYIIVIRDGTRWLLGQYSATLPLPLHVRIWWGFTLRPAAYT